MAVFRYLAFINMALALFNLLPGFPLDGGRLLRAVLWKCSGDLQKATARAADWGNTIAWGLIGLGALEIYGGALVGGLWLIFIGLFLRSAAVRGYQGTVMEQVLKRLRVGDIMTREPIALNPDLSVSEAIERYFLRYGHGGFPVVTDGRAVGVLSLSEIRDLAPEQREQKKVEEVMRPFSDGLEIDPQASALHALHAMNQVHSGRLVVVDRGKFVGLITRGGLARLVQMKTELEYSKVLAGLSDRRSGRVGDGGPRCNATDVAVGFRRHRAATPAGHAGTPPLSGPLRSLSAQKLSSRGFQNSLRYSATSVVVK
jgi:CBS domain-containing protein